MTADRSIFRLLTISFGRSCRISCQQEIVYHPYGRWRQRLRSTLIPIVKTYSWLADQEIIKMQRGIGYFILDSAHQHAVELTKKELLHNDLPKIIQKASLLNISIEELIKKYIHEEAK